MLESFDETTQLIYLEGDLYYVGVNSAGEYGYYRVRKELQQQFEEALMKRNGIEV